MFTPQTVIYALLGGVLPALVWLAFWQSEDKKRPEPRGMIILTFLLGAMAVPLVIPFQKRALELFPGYGMETFLVWAILEEAFKLAAAFYALKSLDDDEPVDPLIYMITAALGFTALENTLFIANPLLQQDIMGTVITGSLRFIGSSLLHTASSGTIGLALALSFYKKTWAKWIAVIVGIALAIFFHTAFNIFLLTENSLSTFLTFSTVWSGIAVLLLAFEVVKRMRKPKHFKQS
jgi:RsiW-degrading membrane proteinase PrsW (M82 family)